MTTYTLTKFLSSFAPFSKVTLNAGDDGSLCLVIDGKTYTESQIDAWFSMWENKPLSESDLPEIHQLTSQIRELMENHGKEPTEVSSATEADVLAMTDPLLQRYAETYSQQAEKLQWDRMIQGPGGGAWSDIPTTTIQEIKNAFESVRKYGKPIE